MSAGGSQPLVEAFRRVLEIARESVIDRPVINHPAMAAQRDADLAAIDLLVARGEPLVSASATLWNAYYGPDADHEDVDWADIQAALAEACKALGLPDEPPEEADPS